MFMHKLRLVIVCGLVLVTCLLGSCIGVWSETPQQQELLSKLRAVVEKKQHTDEEVILRLKDHTSFDWDRVYIFAPYTSTDQIDEALGYRWLRARSTGIEGTDRFYLIVFTSEGKVTDHLMYPTELGDLIYQYEKDQKLKGFNPDEAVFRAEIEYGGVVFRRLNKNRIDANH